MKGKHLHASCFFFFFLVFVGRLLLSILMFLGLDSILNIHFVLLRVQDSINRMTATVLFSSSQSFDHTQLLSLFFIVSACQPKIKRGCPLSAGERKLSFLDEVFLVAGPAGKFYVSHWVSQCAVKGWVFVSWLLIGTFCILPVNSTVDFLICSMWLSSTDQARQVKKNPMEHSTYQPLSALCVCQTYSSVSDSVCECLCTTGDTQENQRYPQC